MIEHYKICTFLKKSCITFQNLSENVIDSNVLFKAGFLKLPHIKLSRPIAI